MPNSKGRILTEEELIHFESFDTMPFLSMSDAVKLIASHRLLLTTITESEKCIAAQLARMAERNFRSCSE